MSSPKVDPKTKTQKQKVATTRPHIIFLYAILTEELNPTQPLKNELSRIKQRIAKTLDTEKVMLQDIS